MFILEAGEGDALARDAEVLREDTDEVGGEAASFLDAEVEVVAAAGEIEAGNLLDDEILGALLELPADAGFVGGGVGEF